MRPSIEVMRTPPRTNDDGRKPVAFAHAANRHAPLVQMPVPALWSYANSQQFAAAIRAMNCKVNVENGFFTKVPFDLDYWQSVAAAQYPNGLPEPESDDSTQWLFHGRPEQSTAPLQVALARLLTYRWPAELDPAMRLSTRARELVQVCDELLPLADKDGIACIPPCVARSRRPAGCWKCSARPAAKSGPTLGCTICLPRRAVKRE